MCQFARIVGLALLVAVAAPVQPGFASALPHELVVQENSSTSLSVTWDGTSISASLIDGFTGDHWTFTAPTTLTGNIVFWQEPGSTTLNSIFSNGSDVLTVSSDISAGVVLGFPNDTGVTIGTAGSDGRFVVATFNDLGDTPLPAALPLFATALGGLGLLGWRRKRKAEATA